MNKSLVSVCIQTYQHKNYIKQCLDGILMQKTNFPFEIILGEDDSTDGTREICIDYANKYPDIIKLYLRSRKDVIYINGNPTGRYNFIENLKASKGKYIALCEGDDYWTDTLKLQKQVGFLEGNPDYNICFHRANMLKNHNQLELHPIPDISRNGEYLYKDLLLHYNFITTASVVFRKPVKFELPDWFSKLPFGDLGLYQLISKGKKIKCLDEVMSVYRIHDKGLWSGLSKTNGEKNYLNFYKAILPYLNSEERAIVKVKMNNVLHNLAKLKYPNQSLFQNGYYMYLRLKNK